MLLILCASLGQAGRFDPATPQELGASWVYLGDGVSSFSSEFWGTNAFDLPASFSTARADLIGEVGLGPHLAIGAHIPWVDTAAVVKVESLCTAYGMCTTWRCLGDALKPHLLALGRHGCQLSSSCRLTRRPHLTTACFAPGLPAASPDSLLPLPSAGQLRDDGVGVSPRRDAPPRGHLEVGLRQPACRKRPPGAASVVALGWRVAIRRSGHALMGGWGTDSCLRQGLFT